MLNPEAPETSSTATPAPQNQGLSLNTATDAVQRIKAFEITVDSLTGDYKDGHFLCFDGNNLDVAMKTREQIAHSMRICRVSIIINAKCIII